MRFLFVSNNNNSVAVDLPLTIIHPEFSNNRLIQLLEIMRIFLIVHREASLASSLVLVQIKKGIFNQKIEYNLIEDSKFLYEIDIFSLLKIMKETFQI
jgi:hypothetical protein